MVIGNGIKVVSSDHLAGSGYFFVGGCYKGEAGKRFMRGQMFVEAYVPKNITRKYPLIFFHGAAQTNLCWIQTPDGRPGWLSYFLSQGYICYLAETPTRGRSAYHKCTDGEMSMFSVESTCSLFIEDEGYWPQAVLHTQWPEDEHCPGNEVFDQFQASQLEFLASNRDTTQMVVDAGEDLFKKTGPAVLVTHSQAGQFGWALADRYAAFVKGIVSVEPGSPCFANDINAPVSENYGIADVPLHFEPPVRSPADFRLVRRASGIPHVRDGLVMQEPARCLPNLMGLPILILVGEASYHAERDYWFHYVLLQAGVENEYVNLADVGLRGNGHMLMLEKNNADIAAWIGDWLENRIGGKIMC